MEWGKQMEKHQENAKLSLYQNTNYSFERRERQTLVLDIDVFDLSSVINWNVILMEPLIIDKLSDIYLDSFITYSANLSTTAHGVDSCFLLGINEFNINNNTGSKPTGNPSNPTNQNIFRKLLIPNESGTAGAGGANTTVIHKGKKMNYICSINPTKLRNLSGTITNLNGDYAFVDNTSRFIAEFIIVARDKE